MEGEPVAGGSTGVPVSVRFAQEGEQRDGRRARYYQEGRRERASTLMGLVP